MAVRRRQRKIDQTRWVNSSFIFGAFSAGTVAATVLAAQSSNDTILRTRGILRAWLDSTQAPGVGVDVAVGMCVVPDGPGTTVLWSPVTDANAPWFWYTRFTLAYEEMVTDVIDVPGMTSFTEVIDSKAMRKIPPDSEVQVVAENVTLLAAGSINVCSGSRMLLGR